MIEAEQKEGFEVVIADAVSDPRTVVVHLWDAKVADTAVMSALRFPIAAALTVGFLITWRRLRDNFWLLESGNCVGQQSHENQEVEEHFVQL